MKIFYSWQSDLPNKTNRSFIRKALEAALKDVAKDINIADAERPPEIDEATKGLVKGRFRTAFLRSCLDELNPYSSAPLP